MASGRHTRVPASDDQTADGSPYTDPNLWLLFAVTLVAVGNVSSVAPAFPRIVDVFGISRVQVGWIVTAYSLPGIVSAPVAGILADRLGRKRVLVPTLVIFGTAGGACALARSMWLLLALRAIQGLAAAPLVGLAITMIGDRYVGRTQATAIGYNASVLNVGTAMYPAVGGGLAALAWFWPFALPLLAVPVAGAIAWKMEAPPLDRAQTLSDYLSVASGRLMDVRVLGLLGVNLGIFILIFGAFLTYVPELLDERFASPPALAGLVLAGASVSSGLVATQLGRLTSFISSERLIQLSLVIDAVALALMPLAPAWWGVGAASVLFGVAQGINQPALQTRLAELSTDASRGVILSVNGMILRLGQAIGPLLLGSALTFGDIGDVFLAAAGVALLVGALALTVLRNSPEG